MKKGNRVARKVEGAEVQALLLLSVAVYSYRKLKLMQLNATVLQKNPLSERC